MCPNSSRYSLWTFFPPFIPSFIFQKLLNNFLKQPNRGPYDTRFHTIKALNLWCFRHETWKNPVHLRTLLLNRLVKSIKLYTLISFSIGQSHDTSMGTRYNTYTALDFVDWLLYIFEQVLSVTVFLSINENEFFKCLTPIFKYRVMLFSNIFIYT